MFLLLFIGFIYMRPVFEQGVFIAGDHPFYLSIAYTVDENLQHQNQLIGWSADNFGGFPVFSPFLAAPLGFLVISLLNKITALSIPALYKGIIFLAYIFPAIALWILLAKRFDWKPAFIAANLYLLMTYHLIQPLQGMWIFYFGLGMIILLIHYFDLYLIPQIKPSQALILGLWVCLTALADAFTWPVLLFLIPLTLTFYFIKRRMSLKPVVLILLALFGSSLLIGVWMFWLLGQQAGWGVEPPQQSMGLTGLLVRLATWLLIPGGSQAIVADIVPAIKHGDFTQAAIWTVQLLGEHLPEAVMMLLFLIGMFFPLFNKEQNLAMRSFIQYIYLIMGLFLLLLVGPWQFFQSSQYLFAPFRPERFVIYLNICLLVIAAYALQQIWRRYSFFKGFGAVAVILAIFSMHLIRYSTYEAYLPMKTSSQSAIYQEMADVWSYVRSHVKGSESRVMYEELEGIGFLDGGSTNLAALSAHETGVSSIAAGEVKSSLSFREPSLLGEQNPLASVFGMIDFLKRFNCSDLVLWHLLIKQRLLESGAFDLVYESQNRLFSILRLKEYQPTWIEFEQEVNNLELTDFQNEHLVFHLYNPYLKNKAILKMNYHPFWSVRFNGGEKRGVKQDKHMILVDDLPQGEVVMEFSFSPHNRKDTKDT